MSMQAYQMCESLEQKEHKRWLAHKDAAVHAAFPTEFTLNGVVIPVYKLPELEALGAKRLKERAMNLRDHINAAKCNLFGHHPELTLNAYAAPDVLLKWMIDVQVTIAEVLGEEDGAGNVLDPAAFGAPEFAVEHPVQSHQQQLRQQQQQYAEWHHAQQSAPCWSQAGVNDGQTPMRQPAERGEYARPVFPWSQHAVVDEQPLSQRTPGQWKQGPPRHDGFSLVPPHLSNDAAMIRHRGHGSSVVLG